MGKKNKVKKIKSKKIDTGEIFRSLYGTINGVDDLSDVRLVVEQEWIDTPSLRYPLKPDPAWSETDTNGHYHAFNLDPFGGEDDLLPTLVVRNDALSYDDQNVSYWHECKICSETIGPEYIPDRGYNPMNARIPGPLSWRVDVQAVSIGAERLMNLSVTEVSFRCCDNTIGLEQFGIGTLYQDQVEAQGTYLRWVGHIVGTSPLGQRKIT